MDYTRFYEQMCKRTPKPTGPQNQLGRRQNRSTLETSGLSLFRPIVTAKYTVTYQTRSN